MVVLVRHAAGMRSRCVVLVRPYNANRYDNNDDQVWDPLLRRYVPREFGNTDAWREK